MSLIVGKTQKTPRVATREDLTCYYPISVSASAG